MGYNKYYTVEEVAGDKQKAVWPGERVRRIKVSIDPAATCPCTPYISLALICLANQSDQPGNGLQLRMNEVSTPKRILVSSFIPILMKGGKIFVVTK